MFYDFEQSRGWDVEPIYDASNVIKMISSHPESPGQSDVGIRNLIYCTVINLRPRMVLEIGCHIGAGAVCIGSALRRNRYGKLITLEPQDHYRKIALDHIGLAGLSDRVEVWPQSTMEDKCVSNLRDHSPFELIFIDGSHRYDDVCHDLDLAYSLLHQNGVMILHDVGRSSAGMDDTGKGGPRKALHDFSLKNPGARTIYLEHPLWLNPCGAAMVCKQQLEPAIGD